MDVYDATVSTIIIDNGSDTCKAGFAKEENPRSVFSCRKIDAWQNDIYSDDFTQIKTVTNWNEVKDVWQHAFYNELKIKPEDHPVILTEIPFNSKANREKTVEIMFESFGTPALYIAIQAVLSLYACGRVTGVALECGNYFSHAIPIFDGYQLPHSTQRLPLAGNHLTTFLLRVLNAQGHSFITANEREIVRDIKENTCYIALELKKEISEAATSDILDKSYTLPDGKIITLSNERFCCPEALFQPTFMNMETEGIHEITYKSIAKCDLDVRKELYGNIVLSGGTTMFPGFVKRLEKEVTKLTPSRTAIHVIAPATRKYSVWIGGSILASLSSINDSWISKKEYDEHGSSIVYKKCI